MRQTRKRLGWLKPTRQFYLAAIGLVIVWLGWDASVEVFEAYAEVCETARGCRRLMPAGHPPVA